MADVLDVLVIGGGAAGLFSGILLGRKGFKVTILEQNKTVGKKLSITGNGQCNYTNLFQSESCYFSQNIKKAYSVVREFDGEKIVSYFKTLGILPSIKKGRCAYDVEAGYVYPMSGSGKDFVSTLVEELHQQKVRIRTNTKVTGIEKREGIFWVKTGENEPYYYQAKKIIITVGGLAMPTSGSDGNLNELLVKTGHRFIPQMPALSFLTTTSKKAKELSGLRIPAKVSILTADGVCIGTEEGEVQFSERGISGIPVMQLSGRVARLKKGSMPVLMLDFFPILTAEECLNFLEKRVEQRKEWSISSFFIGMLPEKLAHFILSSHFSSGKYCKDLSKENISMILKAMKEALFPIGKVGDFPFAQTTSGGISLDEVTDGLQSLFLDDLYFAGEILDVDGLCGGYNLTWAWASAYRVSKAIGEKE